MACSRCGCGVFCAEDKIALNKIWHRACFTCYSCKKPLDKCSAKIWHSEIFCECCFPCPRGYSRDCCNYELDDCESTSRPCRICSSPSTVAAPRCNQNICFVAEEPRCPNRSARSCSCIPDCKKDYYCFPFPLPREVANYYNRKHMNETSNSCPQKLGPCLEECKPPKPHCCCKGPKPRRCSPCYKQPRDCSGCDCCARKQVCSKPCRRPPDRGKSPPKCGPPCRRRQCSLSPPPCRDPCCKICQVPRDDRCCPKPCGRPKGCGVPCGVPMPHKWQPPCAKKECCPRDCEEECYTSYFPKPCKPSRCCPGPGQPPYCVRCGKKVYAAEKILVTGGAYHTNCFSCCCCRKLLDLKNVHENCGEIYCKQCYNNYFGMRFYGYGSIQSC